MCFNVNEEDSLSLKVVRTRVSALASSSSFIFPFFPTSSSISSFFSVLCCAYVQTLTTQELPYKIFTIIRNLLRLSRPYTHTYRGMLVAEKWLPKPDVILVCCRLSPRSFILLYQNRRKNIVHTHTPVVVMNA